VRRVFIGFPGKLSAIAQDSIVGEGGMKCRGTESPSIFGDPQSKFIAQVEFLTDTIFKMTFSDLDIVIPLFL
jgi:hypothetical protein